MALQKKTFHHGSHAGTGRFLTYSLVVPVVAASVLLSGCVSFQERSSASVPLSTILETAQDSRQTRTPTPLSFPASAAIVFIPDKYAHVPKTTFRQAAIELKHTLAENKKYIRSVSVVAGDDVNAKISLNKIRAMYDADIAIILSYQQDQRSRQSGPAGVLDATVVGAFVAPTVGTTTTTVVDAKIIHIPNDAIIFHASGDDRRSTKATSFGNAGAVAEASVDSLMAATNNLGKSLADTLAKFEKYDINNAVAINDLIASDAKGATTSSDKENWNNVNNFKFSGGGSLDMLSLGVVLVLGLWAYFERRREA